MGMGKEEGEIIMYCQFCGTPQKRTEHTKRKDMRYYCNSCGYTNGMVYSTLGCDSK